MACDTCTTQQQLQNIPGCVYHLVLAMKVCIVYMNTVTYMTVCYVSGGVISLYRHDRTGIAAKQLGVQH